MDDIGGLPEGQNQVVALGALCELVEVSDEGRTISCRVGEFAELSDGTRVTLHEDRGFTSSWRGLGPDDVVGAGDLVETVESLTCDVLNVVLPDDDDGEDHPWEWLAGLARQQGLRATAEDLRALPYEVVLAPSVLALTRPR